MEVDCNMSTGEINLHVPKRGTGKSAVTFVLTYQKGLYVLNVMVCACCVYYFADSLSILPMTHNMALVLSIERKTLLGDSPDSETSAVVKRCKARITKYFYP